MENTLKEFKELIEVSQRLLNKETGCPWDLKQNHKSLKSCLVEEAYEVIDAIDNEDFENLQEELGDLLYQIIFNAHLAENSGKFNLDNTISGIKNKLIRRHPHIFSNTKLETSEEVIKNWEAIKKEEKKKKNKDSEHFYDSLPRALPALEKAYTIQKKAGKVGFQWEKIDDVIDKLHEELDELKEAVRENNPEHIEEEIGDILFAAVNSALLSGTHPETALNHSNNKFLRRFRYIEERLKEKNKSLTDSTLEEMDILWNEAKKRSI
ncbi:MAG: nucleoside triphosphate pyrophosphohydrolase [Nitrospinae bacterium]|nr:nucleoside triphosphate pyrophosphohydrolase [Nitrospinota bacterium]